MPAPIDLSVWGSLYLLGKEDDDHNVITPKEANIDFFTGYGVTTVLAVVFAVLGWMVMHGAVDDAGEAILPASGGVGFAKQFVSLYTEVLGPWSFALVVFIALATMVSTTITCLDGYPRSVAASCRLAVGSQKAGTALQIGVMLVMMALAMFIVIALIQNLAAMLTVAMVVAAFTAPVFAFLNTRLMSQLPIEHRPGRGVWLWAVVGLLALVAFLVVYLCQLTLWS